MFHNEADHEIYREVRRVFRRPHDNARRASVEGSRGRANRIPCLWPSTPKIMQPNIMHSCMMSALLAAIGDDEG